MIQVDVSRKKHGAKSRFIVEFVSQDPMSSLYAMATRNTVCFTGAVAGTGMNSP